MAYNLSVETINSLFLRDTGIQKLRSFGNRDYINGWGYWRENFWWQNFTKLLSWNIENQGEFLYRFSPFFKLTVGLVYCDSRERIKLFSLERMKKNHAATSSLQMQKGSPQRLPATRK